MSSGNEDKGTVKKPSEKPESGTALDERLQAHIGSQLKSMYDSYLNEPIPDRLVELLEKLDAVSSTSAPAGRRESGE